MYSIQPALLLAFLTDSVFQTIPSSYACFLGITGAWITLYFRWSLSLFSQIPRNIFNIFLTSCGYDSDYSWLLSQRNQFTHPAESWTSYKWLMRGWFANTISGSYQEDSNVNTYQLQRNCFFFFLHSNNSIIGAGF